jgi:murein DD-endopeptidase MepM/ murein hydrolase activator NlpD
MFIRTAITLVAALTLAPVANAAEYVVQQGDTLVAIAEMTDQSVEQLVIMNAQHDWAMNGLPVGTELTYVSRQDLRDARRWCLQRLRELPESDQNTAIFVACAADTTHSRLHIRYALSEPSGTHYNSVFAYANAWRERRSSAQVWSSMLPGILGIVTSSTVQALAADHTGHDHGGVNINVEIEE